MKLSIDLRIAGCEKPITTLNQFEKEKYPQDIINDINELERNLNNENAKKIFFKLKDYEKKLMKEVRKIRSEFSFLKKLIDKSIPENEIISHCKDTNFSKYGEIFVNVSIQNKMSLTQLVEDFDPHYTMLISDWSEVLTFLENDILPIVENVAGLAADGTPKDTAPKYKAHEYIQELIDKGLVYTDEKNNYIVITEKGKSGLSGIVDYMRLEMKLDKLPPVEFFRQFKHRSKGELKAYEDDTIYKYIPKS